MSYEKELRVAVQAVRKASLLTKRIQSQITSNKGLSSFTKDDNSPVTIGDFGAQAVIINAIKVHFPDDKVVAEETSEGYSDELMEQVLSEIRGADSEFGAVLGDVATEVPLTNSRFPLTSGVQVRAAIDAGNHTGGREGRFWCLDPIDGTKGFLRGAQYAVCLALVVEGVVRLGVIGCPNLQLAPFGLQDPAPAPLGYLFKAVDGSGSFYGSTTSDVWSPAAVRRLAHSSEMVALEGYEKTHSAHDAQAVIKESLGMTRSHQLDSQAKYCLLAAGLGDLYLRLPLSLAYQEKIWDHAAGNVIVREAGGVHTDAVLGQPLDFGAGRTLLTKGVIASCGPASVHEHVVSISSDVIKNR
ncbi:AEL088Cp [Eremothecium gossypii ATCC 10895]|uniref:3'(2'),5'-bisphosphate nucleotidase n=1 Tax=Eremothecium gossypii (strain ATCC 10895 / CBS 109.51 / FGSC 9923 / NRRL Y-1056) TaxID=284811 RepID=Q757V0_EREGS|nr:AEL088Cp [Eremothecium gossypii ATCC 10895]AAS52597.1 AEL088Cp [Eremothecium gossypii ATCC 10895]